LFITGRCSRNGAADEQGVVRKSTISKKCGCRATFTLSSLDGSIVFHPHSAANNEDHCTDCHELKDSELGNHANSYRGVISPLKLEEQVSDAFKLLKGDDSQKDYQGKNGK
jgi:hypothetical protein